MSGLLDNLPAPPVSLRDMVACLNREIRMRESAYPRWVKSGSMTQSDADLELARMRGVLTLVSAIAAPTDELLSKLTGVVNPETLLDFSDEPPIVRNRAEVASRQARQVVRTFLENLVEAAR